MGTTSSTTSRRNPLGRLMSDRRTAHAAREAAKFCPCGRTWSSLSREYAEIERTVGRMAADELSLKHERHEEDAEDEPLID